jgi:septal ring factor EnvC (AmiA/AmiB activator)
VYASELEDGTARSASSLYIYNYRKWNVSFSYSGNFRDVAHGHWLRTQISQLEREQQLLKAEIAQREETVKRLQVRLGKLQNGDLGNADAERARLEQELEAERQAIQKANERLKQLQGEKPQ